MTVTPTIEPEVAPQQLRLLNSPDRVRRPRRSRRRPQPRSTATATGRVWLDARTRAIGQSGVAEARRRLAEIN